MGKTIKLSDNVNPHFYKMWNTKKPYIIAKGGRGSFKSSVISLKLLTMMKKEIIQNHQANVVCIRENQSNLRDSVYRQIEMAMDWLDCRDEFQFKVNPLSIVHRRTGSAFYFYGANDPYKLKSNTVPNIIAVWYEEAANMRSPEVFDQSNPTFIRHKSDYVDDVKVFYSYNPPRNAYAWINEWIEQCYQNEDYFIDTSTYLDDELGFTTPQQLRLIENYKKNDEEYYRWLYLGEVVGLGTNIYNMKLFHATDNVPPEQIKKLVFSCDTGYEVSATAYLCLAITYDNEVCLLDTYYYDPTKHSQKKAPSDLAKDLHEFEERNMQKYRIDYVQRLADSATADFALDNEFQKQYGIYFEHAHKKRKDAMIGYVQNFLATGKFFYLNTESNQIFLDEHKKYRWDENTMHDDIPKPIKEHDHTCDCLQYAILENRFDLNLI
ncbi:MAG TPA: PBSX family phage terminase large subunit [Candidatus Ligilactobacillus faecavium]|nr:PBSX family phage terminase large subunit [Candidatus Ligilactobacillus faecavium]